MILMMLLATGGLLVGVGGCASTGQNWGTWATEHGGIVSDERAARVDRVGQALVKDLVDRPVRFYVLATREVSAYSYPCGDVFVTAGLVDRAGDDEIAAAIAHELGHLLSDGHLRGRVALHEAGQNPNAEAQADAVGMDLLRLRGISPVAMVRALKLVAAHEASPKVVEGLERRITRLEASLKH